MQTTPKSGRATGPGGTAAGGDTIFALASGAGAAGIAVIRVSGPAAGTALGTLTRRPLSAARVATMACLFTPPCGGETGGDSDVVLDEGIVLWFPAPRSFTGEDVAELHVHGGRAVLGAVFDALAALPGLRPAEPGEFTRRAFENGKMDLTRAEALADLVAAETEAQRRQALGQLGGGLAALCESWRERLIAIGGDVEATIDFADEEIPEGLIEGVVAKAARLKEEIATHLDDARRGERLRTGLTAAILGAPNVGKSSLLNRIAGREAAIVAETAGTTRDVIEVHLDLGGLPVTVADTAGLRAAADAVEEEGVRRARDRGRAADIRILVFDARDWPALDRETEALIDGDAFLILNKTDLRDPRTVPGKQLHTVYRGEKYPVYCVSAKTEAGLPEALDGLESLARARLGPGAAAPLTRARHRAALTETAAALARVEPAKPAELIAEDLRLAARAIGRVTGHVDVEDLLDHIFAEFCIGK